jgi:hypothetical protein
MKATGSGLLVRHSPVSFMIGNIGITLFGGSDEVDSSRRELEQAVEGFNAALSHFGHQIGFKTFARVESILTLSAIAPRLIVL